MQNKLQPIVMLSMAFLLNACTPASPDNRGLVKQPFNVPSVTQSKLDDMTVVRMSHVVCPSYVMFELYQDSRSAAKHSVIVSAGLKYPTKIDSGNALHIQLDGKVSSFKTEDLVTTHDRLPIPIDSYRLFSYKKFSMPESYIRQIATAREVLVKVDLLEGGVAEGECTNIELQQHDNPDQDAEDNAFYRSAIGQNGFKKFVELIDTNFQ
jgi:hypothetical protein